MTATLVLITAAFLAGGMNSIAGGGSFLTFPALVYAGLPVVPANATSAVAVFPGYFGGALGFKNEILAFDRKILAWLVALSIAGGLAGSLLLLVTPNQAFRQIVPWLLLFATALFAASDRLMAWTRVRGREGGGLLYGGVFAVSVYGGYFNGGLGIMLMALFAAVGMREMNSMNGLKNALSFVLSAISLVIFAGAGLVRWPEAVLMMVAATLGGYLGARLAKKLSRQTVRIFIVLVGLAMSAVFFIQNA